MSTYKIKTYNMWHVVLVFPGLFTCLFLGLLYFTHDNKLLTYLSVFALFYLIQYAIEKLMGKYVDVSIETNGVNATWTSAGLARKEKQENVLWSDIKEWNFVSNNMSAVFILTTKGNEKLYLRFTNFFSLQPEFTKFLKNFTDRVRNHNNEDTDQTNDIKETSSIYERWWAKPFAALITLFTVGFIAYLFINPPDKLDGIFWLRIILVCSSNFIFVLTILAANNKEK